MKLKKCKLKEIQRNFEIDLKGFEMGLSPGLENASMRDRLKNVSGA